MKRKRSFFALLTAAMMLLTGFQPVNAADQSDDEKISVIMLLRDHLLGKQADIGLGADCNADKCLDARDLTLLKRQCIPEHTWILEPKGTVHTGEATFYGGGYEGGCAMLDPVSRDYWITAMNLADYNCAELAGAYL